MKYVTFIVLIVISFVQVYSQTLPIFNQKLTDYFTYDPSMTGYSGGSAFFTHQRQWTGIEGAPVVNFIGAHTRLYRDQLGLGGSLYYQEAGLFQTFRLAFNAAYHLRLNEIYGLSFGMSPELNRVQINTSDLFVLVNNDPYIQNISNNAFFDFSAGLNFNTPFSIIGIAINRLNAYQKGEDSNVPISGYFTIYAQGDFSLREGLDKAEPMLYFRLQQDGTTQMDMGAFYTYEDLITIGAMYRAESILSFSLGYHIKKRLLLGYSYEFSTGSLGNQLGNSDGITIRYNFNKQFYKNNKHIRNIKTITPEKKG